MKRDRKTKEVIRLKRDQSNRAIPALAITYAIMAGCFYWLATDPGIYVYVMCFVLIGLMQYRIVISCHEAVHFSLLYPKWLNEVVGGINCALVGMNLERYRKQHMTHHWAKSLDDDSDGYIYIPILKAKPGIHRLLVWIFGTVKEIYLKFAAKSFNLSQNKSSSKLASIHSFVLVAVNALLWLVMYHYFNWWFYFAYWVCPVVTLAVFMNRTRVFIEHGYVHLIDGDGQEVSESHKVETVDIVSNPIEKFFISPFSFNYHYCHHKYPTVPHYNNYKVHNLLKEVDEAYLVKKSYIRILASLITK